MFRRRRRGRDEEDLLDEQSLDEQSLDEESSDEESDRYDEDGGHDADDAGAGVFDAAAEEVEPAEPGPTSGPWDVAEAPADDLPRIDLGGLLVPALGELELRLDGPGDGTVTSVNLRKGASVLQLAAFAAPRRTGIWAEIRSELAESLRGSGGSAEEVEGPFGVELRAKVPSESPGQGRVLQPARFLGVDGPRWFLRGLLSGPAATDPAQAGELESVFQQTVVVRGKDAMAPRDPIALRLSREPVEGMEAAAQPQLGRMERGPEIAETR